MSTLASHPRQALRVPPSARATLRAEAAAAWPAECCGALAGVRRADGVAVVTCVLPAPNEAGDPARHFRMGPRAVQALDAEAAALGAEVVGYYHSHPGAPVPSATDAAEAFPGVVHLIAGHRGTEFRAWTLQEDRSGFQELPVVGQEGAGPAAGVPRTPEPSPGTPSPAEAGPATPPLEAGP